MRYCFDIDGTLCDTPLSFNGKPDYENATPIPFMVQQVNQLYDEGNYIILQTARGKGSGIDWTDFTKEQLKTWGYKYHELFPMFCKPTADIFVDDKGINVEDWKKSRKVKNGIIAGAFDIIHPGYVRMFKESKQYCHYLTVALHDDPSVERSHKIKPVQTLNERIEILESIKYVDRVITYKVEEEYLNYLRSGFYNIRFLGDDYKTEQYSGKDIPIQIVWLDRSHNYSTTKLKNQIFESIKGK